MTKGLKMLMLGRAQEQNRLSSLVKISHKHLCENGIRNKKNLLVFTSVVLSPKHGESEESTGKV